jgi:hypothetical protein
MIVGIAATVVQALLGVTPTGILLQVGAGLIYAALEQLGLNPFFRGTNQIKVSAHGPEGVSPDYRIDVRLKRKLVIGSRYRKFRTFAGFLPTNNVSPTGVRVVKQGWLRRILFGPQN